MPLTQPTLGKYLVGMGASLLLFLAGVTYSLQKP